LWKNRGGRCINIEYKFEKCKKTNILLEGGNGEKCKEITYIAKNAKRKLQRIDEHT
jgi:hypothetical protein